MDSAIIKVRLKAAAQKAKLPGESVQAEVIERGDGMATVGVIFKKGHKSVEEVSHHGSSYSVEEKEKLVNDTLQSLELRSKRSSSR